MLDLFTVIIAGISLLISILSIRHNKFITVNTFFEKIESNDFIAAKKYVYTNEVVDTENEEAATIVNFFHHWGLLVKRHYLPMWVFDKATGEGACRLYLKTKKYIDNRREFNLDQSYGEYFEWLYKKLKKREKKLDFFHRLRILNTK